MKKNNSSKGFSIIEIVLAGAVLSIITTVIISAYIYRLKNTQYNSKRTMAINLSRECLEAARNIKEENFTYLTEGTHGLAYYFDKWQLISTPDVTDIYIRTIDVSSIDADTKQVVCTVTWPQYGSSPGTVSLQTYFKNWEDHEIPPNYPLDPIGAWNLDEGSGDIVEDEAGNCDGTIYNGAEWVDGHDDYGLDFDDQSQQYVEGDCLLTPDYPFTINLWVRITEPLDEDGVLFAIADSNKQNTYYGIYVREDGYVVSAARNGKKVKTAVSSTQIDDGEWHMITGIFGGKKSRKIYVDGLFETENTSSVNYKQAADRWAIGRWPDSSPDDYFKGEIDQVLFYERVLNDSEIYEIYNF